MPSPKVVQILRGCEDCRCVSRMAYGLCRNTVSAAVVRRRYSSSACGEADMAAAQREQRVTDAVGFGPSIHPFQMFEEQTWYGPS
jgi:hypothetical protein